MGFSNGAGEPTSDDPTGLAWYLTFYVSNSAYLANPFSQNDALPETKWFTHPTNPEWQTIIGSGDFGYVFRYLEFDVSNENWMTTPGEIQGIGIFSTLGSRGESMSSVVALSNGANAISAEEDWAAAFYPPSTFYGPDTLLNIGYTERFAAFIVETVAVPEPSGISLSILGVIATVAWGSIRRHFQRPS